jgi:plasmid maintenance system antidote protein VapI
VPAQKTGPRKRAPIHPGHLVGSSLETLGLSARAAARRLNVTPMGFVT